MVAASYMGGLSIAQVTQVKLLNFIVVIRINLKLSLFRIKGPFLI